MNDKRVYTPAEQATIEKHRNCNTDYEWWDCTYEDFIGQMAKIGIDLDKEDIEFSGFWSQGDGACFTFSSVRVAHVLDAGMALEAQETRDGGALVERIVGLYDTLKDKFGTAYLTSAAAARVLSALRFSNQRISHHYSHSNTCRVNLCCDEVDDDDAAEVLALFGTDWDIALEKALNDDAKAIANQLYRDLESTYDDLTSDDEVWSTIEDNEWHVAIQEEPHAQAA